MIPAPDRVAKLLQVFAAKANHRWGDRRFIRDRLVASCGGRKRRRVLHIALGGPSDREAGDWPCLGCGEFEQLSADEWRLVSEAVPTFADFFELAPADWPRAPSAELGHVSP
jgi:hypothetical protein